MTLPQPPKLFVVGAGLMGSGIAQTAARSGLEVQLFDSRPGAAATAAGQIGERLWHAEEAGRLAAGGADAATARLAVADELGAAAATADVIVEAITEELGVKLELWRDLDQICAGTVLFTSNTSSIPITRLAAATSRPEQFMGMHFYSPVPVMKLVELIRGVLTSDDTFTSIEGLSRQLGKTPVSSADTPGFIGNRILIPFINEAIKALQEGVGTAADIDEVARLGFRHPMGPLELADFIGLDVILGICQVMYEGLHDPRYAANPLLERLVAAGQLGRKTGRGFHPYDDSPGPR
ncbi:MAG TPA: 3-hydroxyacyl-CoA dehydrogenase NAD-binding domain-containing protein [Candidatus Dormibacteraeota bacterium]|nr:3-hydroxyacyl-CoA dehydrogenase NAD-binding domain-containing protein [Candidatus Dormibacteraeota bacterium]